MPGPAPPWSEAFALFGPGAVLALLGAFFRHVARRTAGDRADWLKYFADSVVKMIAALTAMMIAWLTLGDQAYVIWSIGGAVGLGGERTQGRLEDAFTALAEWWVARATGGKVELGPPAPRPRRKPAPRAGAGPRAGPALGPDPDPDDPKDQDQQPEAIP